MKNSKKSEHPSDPFSKFAAGLVSDFERGRGASKVVSATGSRLPQTRVGGHQPSAQCSAAHQPASAFSPSSLSGTPFSVTTRSGGGSGPQTNSWGTIAGGSSQPRSLGDAFSSIWSSAASCHGPKAAISEQRAASSKAQTVPSPNASPCMSPVQASGHPDGYGVGGGNRTGLADVSPTHSPQGPPHSRSANPSLGIRPSVASVKSSCMSCPGHTPVRGADSLAGLWGEAKTQHLYSSVGALSSQQLSQNRPQQLDSSRAQVNRPYLQQQQQQQQQRQAQDQQRQQRELVIKHQEQQMQKQAVQHQQQQQQKGKWQEMDQRQQQQPPQQREKQQQQQQERHAERPHQPETGLPHQRDQHDQKEVLCVKKDWSSVQSEEPCQWDSEGGTSCQQDQDDSALDKRSSDHSHHSHLQESRTRQVSEADEPEKVLEDGVGEGKGEAKTLTEVQHNQDSQSRRDDEGQDLVMQEAEQDRVLNAEEFTPAKVREENVQLGMTMGKKEGEEEEAEAKGPTIQGTMELHGELGEIVQGTFVVEEVQYSEHLKMAELRGEILKEDEQEEMHRSTEVEAKEHLGKMQLKFVKEVDNRLGEHLQFESAEEEVQDTCINDSQVEEMLLSKEDQQVHDQTDPEIEDHMDEVCSEREVKASVVEHKGLYDGSMGQQNADHEGEGSSHMPAKHWAKAYPTLVEDDSNVLCKSVTSTAMPYEACHCLESLPHRDMSTAEYGDDMAGDGNLAMQQGQISMSAISAVQDAEQSVRKGSVVSFHEEILPTPSTLEPEKPTPGGGRMEKSSTGSDGMSVEHSTFALSTGVNKDESSSTFEEPPVCDSEDPFAFISGNISPSLVDGSQSGNVVRSDTSSVCHGVPRVSRILADITQNSTQITSLGENLSPTSDGLSVEDDKPPVSMDVTAKDESSTLEEQPGSQSMDPFAFVSDSISVSSGEKSQLWAESNDPFDFLGVKLSAHRGVPLASGTAVDRIQQSTPLEGCMENSSQSEDVPSDSAAVSVDGQADVKDDASTIEKRAGKRVDPFAFIPENFSPASADESRPIDSVSADDPFEFLGLQSSVQAKVPGFSDATFCEIRTLVSTEGCPESTTLRDDVSSAVSMDRWENVNAKCFHKSTTLRDDVSSTVSIDRCENVNGKCDPLTPEEHQAGQGAVQFVFVLGESSPSVVDTPCSYDLHGNYDPFGFLGAKSSLHQEIPFVAGTGVDDMQKSTPVRDCGGQSTPEGQSVPGEGAGAPACVQASVKNDSSMTEKEPAHQNLDPFSFLSEDTLSSLERSKSDNVVDDDPFDFPGVKATKSDRFSQVVNGGLGQMADPFAFLGLAAEWPGISSAKSPTLRGDEEKGDSSGKTTHPSTNKDPFAFNSADSSASPEAHLLNGLSSGTFGNEPVSFFGAQSPGNVFQEREQDGNMFVDDLLGWDTQGITEPNKGTNTKHRKEAVTGKFCMASQTHENQADQPMGTCHKVEAGEEDDPFGFGCGLGFKVSGNQSTVQGMGSSPTLNASTTETSGASARETHLPTCQANRGRGTDVGEDDDPFGFGFGFKDSPNPAKVSDTRNGSPLHRNSGSTTGRAFTAEENPPARQKASDNMDDFGAEDDPFGFGISIPCPNSQRTVSDIGHSLPPKPLSGGSNDTPRPDVVKKSTEADPFAFLSENIEHKGMPESSSKDKAVADDPFNFLGVSQGWASSPEQAGSDSVPVQSFAASDLLDQQPEAGSQKAAGSVRVSTPRDDGFGFGFGFGFEWSNKEQQHQWKTSQDSSSFMNVGDIFGVSSTVQSPDVSDAMPSPQHCDPFIDMFGNGFSFGDSAADTSVTVEELNNTRVSSDPGVAMSEDNTAHGCSTEDPVDIDDTMAPPPGLSLVSAKRQGDDLFRHGKFEEALKYFSLVLMLAEKIGPMNVEFFGTVDMLLKRATCYKEMGRYKKAVEDCTKVLELQPLSIIALEKRALLYETMEKYNLGIADLEKILEYNPSNKEAMRRLPRMKEALHLLMG